MKAIIMAGGFGTRLMPVTALCPKPMIRIMDKPIIEYTLELLKKHNITDACVTLGYLPKIIQSHLTAAHGLGVNLRFITEDTPMGTAGSVKMCQEYLDGDDFIVISGDAVCDFDLGACIDRHYELGSKASILLYSHPEPLEFGLVVTGDDGRIQGFVEKPSWDRVETNLVNTGIYVFSNEILDRIPKGRAWDFGKDVFPALLDEGYPLYGIEAEGYWCDVGNPAAYRQCSRDILEGRTSLTIPASIPPRYDISVTGPAYISPDAHIASGAVIGRYSVIGAGSVIGKNAKITDSVIDGATVMEACDIDGAILCRNAQALPGAKVGEGCVIAGETVIGGRAVLMPGVSVWPRQRIGPGELVNKSIVSGALRGFPEFSSPGRMSGKYNSSLTPELCFELGASCAPSGRVGVACSVSPAASALASSFSCGVSAAGGDPVVLDIGFPSGASYLGRALNLTVTAFISVSGDDAEITFTDSHGLPVTRDTERKLEAAFSSGRKFAPPDSTAVPRSVTGCGELYSAAVIRTCGSVMEGAGIRVNVPAQSPENEVLGAILTACGCELDDSGYGVPMLEVTDSGTGLRAKDENGNGLSPDQLMCILIRLGLESGGPVAVPIDAPRAMDKIGEELGIPVLRVGKDDGAEELYRNEPWMWDGVFAGVKLISAMALTGMKLLELRGSVPDFAVTSREVAVKGSRSDAMRALSNSDSFESDDGPGLRYFTEKGYARVRPMIDREALSIVAECATVEAAEELCGEIRDIIEGTNKE